MAKKQVPVWEQSLLVPITIIGKLKKTEARFVTVQAAGGPYGANRRDYAGVVRLSIERRHRYGRATPEEIQADREVALKKLSVAALILMEYGYGVEFFDTSYATIEAHVFQYEDAAEKAVRVAAENEAARLAAMVTQSEKFTCVLDAKLARSEVRHEAHEAVRALRKRLFKLANEAANLELYLGTATMHIEDAETMAKDVADGLHDCMEHGGLLRDATDQVRRLRNRYDAVKAAEALEIRDDDRNPVTA